MVNIVHYEVKCDNERNITAIRIKLRSFQENEKSALQGQALYSTASAAFYKTTLLADVGKLLETIPNPKRKDIVNLNIKIRKGNLKPIDIANFITAFQEAIDTTSLF